MVTAPIGATRPRPGDDDVGDVARRRRVAGILRPYERDAVLEVQRVDQVTLALVQVDRAGVHRRGRLARARAAEHSAGAGLEDRDLAARRPADVHRRVRVDAGRGEVAGGPPPQQPVVDERLGNGFGVPHPHLGFGQREFGCRAEQLGPEHVRVDRVDDDALDRLVQQRAGIVDEVGVERVVARDHDDQRALPPPSRPARLLPEGGDGAGEPGQHHGVQTRDVDAQFEGVGGGQSAQPAVGQRALQAAAVLGEVAGAVGGDQVDQFRCDVLEPGPCAECGEFGAATRADEGQRPRAFGHQVGHHAGRLGSSRSPYRGAVLARSGRPAVPVPTAPPCARPAVSRRRSPRRPFGRATPRPWPRETPSSRWRRSPSAPVRRRRSARTAASTDAAPSRRSSRRCRGSNGIRRPR